MLSPLFRIGIVGGGAVGVSLAYHIVERALSASILNKINIQIFECRERAGTGLAYEADLASNLLNTQAGSISVVSGQRDHFYRWLYNHHERWQEDFPQIKLNKDSFLPRSLFGRYLCDVLHEIQQTAAKKGSLIRIVNSCEIIDIEPIGESYQLLSSKGDSYECDYVFLCCGNLDTDPYPDLVGLPTYHASPYPTSRLIDCINPQAKVAIIGSRLSAIDATIALAESGYEGKLELVSRGGRLPSVRGSYERCNLHTLTSESIRSLARQQDGLTLIDVCHLISQEIDSHTQGGVIDIKTIMKQHLSPHDYLIEEILQSLIGKPRVWQCVLYALNEVVDVMWDCLRYDAKVEFIEKWRSLYWSYRVSIPLENACKILNLIRNEKLSVYGGLKSIVFKREKGDFLITVQAPGDDYESTFRVDEVINASGYDATLKSTKVPLICNLLSRGLLVPHYFGGAKVEFDSGRAINQDGTVLPRLFIVGALTSGVYLFTNALDINTRHTKERADLIIKEISKQINNTFTKNG